MQIGWRCSFGCSCIDLLEQAIERPEVVAERIRKALRYLRPGDVILAPDCGMKYLPREVADGKLRSMVAAAKLLRAEYSGRA
jgi:5-methyltetrahydropteroyltriglutamate--homocysteine methyltransferase